MTLNEIFAEASTLSYDDRKKLVELLHLEHVSRFSVGDKVFFKAGGEVVQGVIKRCNKKTVTLTEVNNPTKGWTVSYSYLQKVPKETT